MKPSEVINGAITLISNHGLNKGDYGNEAVGFCTVGALDVAAGWRSTSGGYDYLAFDQARQYVAQAAGTKPFAIAAWSDAPEQTKEAVLATLTNARDHAIRAGE